MTIQMSRWWRCQRVSGAGVTERVRRGDGDFRGPLEDEEVRREFAIISKLPNKYSLKWAPP